VTVIMAKLVYAL